MANPKPLPVEAIAAKYHAGASLRALAFTYHVSEDTIRQRLKAHGVELRPQGGPGLRYGWQRCQLWRNPAQS